MNHHSSLYNNAPMPYTERFTNDGVALHAGGVPGYPESHGCVHLPSEHARLLAGQPFRCEPEKSSYGPVSIVLSRADARMVVLRNGVEIGRAKVLFKEPEKPVGTQVLVATQAVGTGAQWISVGVVGHMDTANTVPDPSVAQRIVMPRDFQQLLLPLVDAGTTMMVTDAPILEHTTGKQLALLSSHPGTADSDG